MTFRRSIIALTLTVALMLAASGTALASTRTGRVMRARMLGLVNGSRHAHGLRSLGLNLRLSGYAWHHSLRMVRAHSLCHTANMWREIRPFGAKAWGENVGMTTATLPILERAFMASPEHRRNILSRRFHHIGIGVIRVRGRSWVTLDFYG